MTVVRVNHGACGFVSRITAVKEGRRRVRIQIESECESVKDLNVLFEETGPLSIREFMSVGADGNRVSQASEENLPHSACPLQVAIIKAAEVELGMNVPADVTIEFE